MLEKQIFDRVFEMYLKCIAADHHKHQDGSYYVGTHYDVLAGKTSHYFEHNGYISEICEYGFECEEDMWDCVTCLFVDQLYDINDGYEKDLYTSDEELEQRWGATRKPTELIKEIKEFCDEYYSGKLEESLRKSEEQL